MSSRFPALFKSSVSLLIFSLVFLSIVESGVLEFSTTIIELLFLSLFCQFLLHVFFEIVWFIF